MTRPRAKGHRPKSAPAAGALAILLAAATVLFSQQARDNTPVTPGTASISGTVFMDGAAKQPARRVRVTLTDLARTSPGQTTTTDDNGAFAFRGLRAGRFELQAFRNGYLRSSYGASRPERAGTPIVVKDGETIANLMMTIARGGVITGNVRDLQGRPVPGVSVRVLKLGYNAITGEPTLGAPSMDSSVSTDDRGEYRAFGLPPGGYLVVADAASTAGRVGGPGVDDIRVLTTDEVRQAIQTASSTGTATTTASSNPSSSTRVTYAPVFHPGHTDINAAATIVLGLSEERTGVDVPIRLVPTATISGTITSPTGALPSPLSVTIVPAGPRAEMLAGAGLRRLSTTPRPDGTYVIGGVAPGTYFVKAGTTRGRGAAPADPTTLSAAVEVNVSGVDLDVPLTLQPGVLITGRVVFEGAQPTAAELQALSFMLMAPGSGGQIESFGGGRVNAEGRFSFASVPPDVYRFARLWSAPGASSNWTIKSSSANGRDAFEAPLRVNPNEPVDWTITFTDKPAILAGSLQDRGGRATTDYYILVFASDRKSWTPGSRRTSMTRPATDGAFSFKGLPPGEYLLAALTDLESGEWNDPALLEQLVRFALKVTLRDGETTTQDVKIGRQE